MRQLKIGRLEFNRGPYAETPDQGIQHVHENGLSETLDERHVGSLETSILHRTIAIRLDFSSLWKRVDGSRVSDLHRTDDRQLP